MDIRTVDTVMTVLAVLFLAVCAVKLLISIVDEFRWRRRVKGAAFYTHCPPARDEHEELHGDVPTPTEVYEEHRP